MVGIVKIILYSHSAERSLLPNIWLLYNRMVILLNVRFCQTFSYFTIIWSFCRKFGSAEPVAFLRRGSYGHSAERSVLPKHSVTLQLYGHFAERSVLPNIRLLYNRMVILPLNFGPALLIKT